MTFSSWTPLMHAVLDGEATSEQEAALEARLAADPESRVDFEQLEQLFHRLATVPSAHPPEGLVAAVSAAIGEYSRTDQRFGQAGVLGSTARDFGTYSNPPPADSAHSFSSIIRENSMNQQTKTPFANRKAWVGGGIAAVAAAVAVAFAMGGLPRNEDVNGTIVAAERYRAPQATTQDVAIGDPSIALLLQNDAFLRAIKDPQVQALVAEPDFLPASQLMLDNPEAVRKALAGTPDSQASAAIRTLSLHSAGAMVLLQNPEANTAMLRNRKASLSFVSADLRAGANGNPAVSADRNLANGNAAVSADRNLANGNAAVSADRNLANGNAAISADRNLANGNAAVSADRNLANGNAAVSADRNLANGNAAISADRNLANGNAAVSADRNLANGNAAVSADRNLANGNAAVSADRNLANGNAAISADRNLANGNAAVSADRNLANGNAAVSADRNLANGNAAVSADRNLAKSNAAVSADRNLANGNAAVSADRNLANGNAAISADRSINAKANAATSADRVNNAERSSATRNQSQ